MNDDRFRKDADLLLGGLHWTRADANEVLSAVRGEKHTMKRKARLGLVLATIILLLAAVALAIGLSYSPKHTAVQTARRAVMAKYGLTTEMLQQYSESVVEQDGVTTVTYRGIASEFLKVEPMGEYTATVDMSGNAAASWSHDGADASVLQSGDLTSDVWGPKQLQRVIDCYQYYRQWQSDVEKDAGYLGLLPISEQASRLAKLDAAIAPCHVYVQRTDLPEASDIPEDEALALATLALKDVYDVELTDEWCVERSFEVSGDDGRGYLFRFLKGGVVSAADLQHHDIRVLSPSGAVVTEKDKLTQAVGGAADGLSRDQALALAGQTLDEWYHLDSDMLTLFTAVPSLNETDGNAVWTIAYLPVTLSENNPFVASNVTDWRWSHELTPKLGSYLVELNAKTGELQNAAWTLHASGVPEQYTQSDWANAKVYDASVLPYVLNLLRHNADIIAKYPEDQTDWFSVEDAAAYDQAFRDAGFDPSRYCHGLPKAGDLSLDEAKRIAIQAMQNDYGMTQADVDGCYLTCEYALVNGGEWRVGFYSALGMGNVTLNAATGEVQQVYLDSGAASNG